MSRPKVAFYWCASCGGCDEAVIDLAENILPVVEAVDIVFWPVALDFKRKDVEALKDRTIDVAFINGAIRLSEQEEIVKLLREKSKLVIAYGTCAYLGGIPGLANLTDRESILRYVYQEAPSMEANPNTIPQEHVAVAEGELELPHFDETVRTLDQVIDVDYYIPGCPPPPQLTLEAVQKILKGGLPSKGAVLAPAQALCHECERNASKPERLMISDIKRVHEVIPDPKTCLLAQGLLCLGPVTRGGCGALCVQANMPCTGCFGPLEPIRDFGGKMLSMVASIVDSTDEKVLRECFAKVPDPAGTFYRYSLPAALLPHRRPSNKR